MNSRDSLFESNDGDEMGVGLPVSNSVRKPDDEDESDVGVRGEGELDLDVCARADCEVRKFDPFIPKLPELLVVDVVEEDKGLVSIVDIVP